VCERAWMGVGVLWPSVYGLQAITAVHFTQCCALQQSYTYYLFAFHVHTYIAPNSFFPMLLPFLSHHRRAKQTLSIESRVEFEMCYYYIRKMECSVHKPLVRRQRNGPMNRGRVEQDVKHRKRTEFHSIII
jgi:hypothetical protein